MSDNTHECPYPGCEERVPFDQFACRPHWYSVPKPLRDELWRHWRAGDYEAHARTRQTIVETWMQEVAKGGFWCELCKAKVETPGVDNVHDSIAACMEHFEQEHPAELDAIDRWPDGAPVVVDESLEPGDFNGTD